MTHDFSLGVYRRFRRMARRRPMIVRCALWFPLLLVVAACGSDMTEVAPALPADQVLVRVQLEYPVINLAMESPYNTVQLRATGYSGTGQIIDAPIEYSVSPSSAGKLSVSPTGMLSALSTGTKLIVRASMRHNGAIRSDSAYVYVIAGTPNQHLARMRFVLASQDSAKFAVNQSKTIQISAEDSAGGDMSWLPVKVLIEDTTKVVSFLEDGTGIAEGGFGGWFVGMRPGAVMIYASTYAYGVSMKDSLQLRVGWPLSASISAFSRYTSGTTTQVLDFFPGRIIVGVGACVIWTNTSEDEEIDVTFDDPSLVGPSYPYPSPGVFSTCAWQGRDGDQLGGNIAPFKTSPPGPNNRTWRIRSFAKPGVYTYRSTIWGTTGTIVVCDEKKDDPICSPDNYKWFASNP